MNLTKLGEYKLSFYMRPETLLIIVTLLLSPTSALVPDPSYGGGRVRRQAAAPGFSLHALLLEETDSAANYAGGSISVLTDKTFRLLLVGAGLEAVTRVKFTTANNTAGGECKGAAGASHHQSQVSRY